MFIEDMQDYFALWLDLDKKIFVFTTEFGGQYVVSSLAA